MVEKLCGLGNQQPSLEQRKVQRPSRKRVGRKRVRSGEQEDMVCSPMKVGAENTGHWVAPESYNLQGVNV